MAVQTLPSITIGDPAREAQRRRALRRMRMVAVGLLVLAAAIYLLTLDGSGWVGFVNAAAEAAMVGAVADWFAVVALFKRPLGLPIPHTALIPNRKDDLGRSLEEFVTENFLSEQVIRERLATADLGSKAAAWLADEQHARRVVREGAVIARAGLARLRTSDIEAIVGDVLIPRLSAEPLSPVLGALLREVVADGAHRGLVDVVLDEAREWLVENEATFTEVVADRAPAWAPGRINAWVGRRLHHELVEWIGEVSADPDHRVRRAIDDLLGQLADDLLHNPDVQRRTEDIKSRLLHHPQVLATSVSLWEALRRTLDDALADADGLLIERLVAELVALGEQLQDDQGLRASLEERAADFVVFLIDRYGDELTAVITHTINRWDGKEASRRIETFVGKDLQFIRINGTVVGGLVGVVIHAATVAL